MTTNNHDTRQYSDQLFCSKCGKTWDVNDPDPPPCTQPVTRIKTGEQWLAEIKQIVKGKD